MSHKPDSVNRRVSMPVATVPPIQFDGRFHWYTEWFDPSDDRCSRCQGPIAEDDVPLVLFKAVGPQTWQARFCADCTHTVVALLKPRPADGR